MPTFEINTVGLDKHVENQLREDLKFQKEVSTQLQKECDIEHIRFLDEQQKRGDDLCLISQALGIDYHGDNDDIFKAIKQLKEENKRLTQDSQFLCRDFS